VQGAGQAHGSGRVTCVWCVVQFAVAQNGKLVETIDGPNTPALERAIYLHTPANPDMDDLEVRM
jgi:hypothetical protein